jgi:hypothetical protein
MQIPADGIWDGIVALFGLLANVLVENPLLLLVLLVGLFVVMFVRRR